MKDEDDKLWDLLGQAKRPDVSPFFARNVLRTVRLTQQERSGFFAWLRRDWRVVVPVGVTALAVILTSGMQKFSPHTQPQHNPLVAQIVSNPDYEVINHLDELDASDENALWLESSVD